MEGATPTSGTSKPTTIIIGGGVMGLSVAYQLSLSEVQGSLIVIDANSSIRSSHGERRNLHSSITSLIYYRMVLRALEIWKTIEEECYTDRKILCKSGRLNILNDDHLTSRFKFLNSIGVEFELINSSSELSAKFPSINIGSDNKDSNIGGLYSTFGYILKAENALNCLRAAIRKLNPNLSYLENQTALQIDTTNKIVHVDSGQSYSYDKLVIACGAWTNTILKKSKLRLLPLYVTCEQVIHFAPHIDHPNKELFTSKFLPCFRRSFIDLKTSRIFNMYASPSDPELDFPSIKFGHHRGGPVILNDEFCINSAIQDKVEEIAKINGKIDYLDSQLNETDLHLIRHIVDQTFTGLDTQQPTTHYRCLYTNTLDLDFILGPHPDNRDIIVVCGFCGSGFAFAPLIGEFVAYLLHPADKLNKNEECISLLEDMCSYFDPIRRCQNLL